jgi:hypothetical protein
MWRRWANVFCFLIPDGMVIRRTRHPRDKVGYSNGYSMSAVIAVLAVIAVI